MLESLVAEWGARERPDRFDNAIDGIEFSGQREQGQPDVLLLEEPDRDLLPDLHVGRLAIDDVRREVDPGVLGQCDVGDHVRRIEVRQPAVSVDRETDDRAAAGHRGRFRRSAPAIGADGNRRVDQFAAVAALLNAEHVISTGGPEPLVGRGQLRKRPHGASLTWPGGAHQF